MFTLRPFEMRALQQMRTRTNDLSVATPLAGEDISVCDCNKPNAILQADTLTSHILVMMPAFPHRAIASANEDRTVVMSNSCTYLISPPHKMPSPPRQVTVITRLAFRGDAPPTAPATTTPAAAGEAGTPRQRGRRQSHWRPPPGRRAAAPARPRPTLVRARLACSGRSSLCHRTTRGRRASADVQEFQSSGRWWRAEQT